MQSKVKKAVPFAVLLLILLNTLFSQQLLIGIIGQYYTLVYLPLFWVALAAVSLIKLRKKHYRESL